MDKKLCSSCNLLLSTKEFYKNPKLKDGLFNICKACHKDRVSKYQKTEKGKLSRRRYANSELGKKAYLKSRRKDVKKIKARNSVYRAMKKNSINRICECQLCKSNVLVEGHHHDYNFPLKLIFLCSKCHHDYHNNKLKKEYLEKYNNIVKDIF